MFGFGSTNPTSSPFGGGGFGTNTTFGQPSTNTFGTPSTSFGTTPSTPSFGTGFGTSTGFGQPSTTGFGATPTPSFGSTFGSTTPSTGFGTGFGTTPSTGFGQPTSPGGFGTPSTTPSTGFGATSTSTGLFGSSNTFGSQPSTGGLFGSTPSTSTGGLFGSTPSTTTTAPFGSTFPSTTPSTGFGFGSTTPSTGFGLTGGTPGAPTGTGNPPYKTTPDADTGTGTTLQMISITAMQNYQGKSFEELRWEDYQLKKNSGNFTSTMSTGPAFGTTLGTTPSTGGSLFGSTPAFGTQPSTTPAPSTGFGGFSSTPSTGGSLFGSTPFGSTPSTTPSTFGTSTPSTFGTSTPSTFGTSTSAPFGTSTTSTFGQPSTSSTFGQPSSTTTPGFNFSTGFGTSSTPSTSSSFSFSQPSTTGNPSTTPFSFSSAPSTTAPSSSFLTTPSTNLFGSSTSATPNLFGSTTTSTLPSFGTAPSSVSTGLFNNPSTLSTPSLGFNFSSTPSTGFGSGFPSVTGAPTQPKQATITGSPFGMVPIPSLAVNGAPTSPAPTATITPTTAKVKKAAPSPHFKLTPRSAAKMKPRGFVGTSALGKSASETPMSPDIFVPRESIKKLTIDMSVSEEEPERPVKPIHSGSASSVGSTVTKDSRKFGSSTSPINLSGLNSSQVTPQSTPQNKTATTPVTEVIQKPIAKRGPIEQQTLSSIKKIESPIASAEIPKLNRPGYWMSPRVEELSRLTSEQLAAVENFRVGLEDVGSVQFVGQTDVRNLDLDKIIEFSRGEIVVYPDEHAKPPVGEGLNKTAVITLHGCFPLDRATGRPKLDDDSLSRYEAKILKSTSRLGANFIKYEKRTGDWVFQVHHFSRYGLLDDSDEEEEETTTGSTNLQQYGSMDKFPITQPVFTTPTPNRFKIGESDSDREDQNEHPLAEEVMDEIPTATLDDGETLPEELHEEEVAPEPQDNEVELPDIPVEDENFEEELDSVPKLPSQLGINASKLKAMRSVFFAEDLSGKADISPPRHFDSPIQVDYLQKKPLSPWREERRSDLQITTDFRTQESILKVDIRKSDYIDPIDSISHKKQHMIADSGLYLGRSFRVCFGANGLLVHSGRPTGSQKLPSTFSTVTIEKLEVLPGIRQKEEAKKHYSALLESQLQSSRLHLNEDRVPTLSIEDLDVYLNTTISALEQSLVQDKEFSQFHFEEQAKNAFALIKALWGKYFSADSFFKCSTRYLCDDPSYPELLARRMSINNWLKSIVAPSVARDIRSSKDLAESVFFHLTGKQIKDAVSAAIQNRDLRMSTLVAQAFSNTTIRSDMENQIKLWQSNGTATYVSDSRMKLFKLLSGDVNAVSMGLDWKRSFGLHFWYAHPTNAPISNPVTSYERTFTKGLCCAPIPSYLENTEGLLPTRLDQINAFNTVALTNDHTLYIWNKSGIFKKDNRSGNHWIKVEKSDDVSTFQSSTFVSIFPMTWDLNYYILKIFSDNKNWKDNYLFNQIYYSKHTTPYVLDARLNWHIHCILRALDNSVIPEDKLFVDYASQLEASGLWQWAAYVLLYLPQSSTRDQLIKYLLSRHANEIDEHREFLLTKLSIPESWVEEAKAWLSCNERNYIMQAKQLMKAGKYSEALVVIVQILAPDCILKGETEDLFEILLEIEKHAQSIPEWKSSGILFIEFLSIEKKLKDILTGLVADQMELYELLEQMEKRVYALCELLETYIKTVDSNSLDLEKRSLERICLAEIGSKLSGFLVSIKKMLNLDELTQSRRLLQVAPTLLHISIPEDARLMHLNELTRFYLRDQVECLGS